MNRKKEICVCFFTAGHRHGMFGWPAVFNPTSPYAEQSGYLDQDRESYRRGYIEGYKTYHFELHPRKPT